MLRTILFDFNGVLVDDEPLHFLFFQKTLAQKKVRLDREDYYQKYLGYDDRDCFKAVLQDAGMKVSGPLIEELLQIKSKLYDEEALRTDLFVPGAAGFVKEAAKKYYLGVVSGALKNEIVSWLKKGQLLSNFQVLISAEDVKRGKPNPEGFLRALDLLNRDFVSSSEIILPQECLVIEDSVWGIEAAKTAGMKCLALTTSYAAAQLTKADKVAKGFTELSFERLEEIF